MFSERSLRVQWRFAQAILAVPLVLFAVGWIVLGLRLVVDPAGAVELAWDKLSHFPALTTVACLVGILLIERHLAAAMSSPAHQRT